MKSSNANQLARALVQRLGKPTIDRLYDSMRRAVYGLPGNVYAELPELVEEMSLLLDKVDPSSSEVDL